MIDKSLNILFWGYLIYLVVFGYEAPTSPDGLPLMLGIFGGKKKKVVARDPVTDVAAVKRSGEYWTSRSYAEVADLISEGPIEGIVSGEYQYTRDTNITGYKSAKFVPYTATGVGGSSTPHLGFLQSVFWNEVPVVDKEGLYNFPSININYVKGAVTGDTPNLNTDLPGYGSFKTFSADSIMDLSITRSIGERLYGPEIKGGADTPTTTKRAQLKGPIDKYAKTYTILNQECSSLIVNIKVPSLFESIQSGQKQHKKKRRPAAVGYGDTKAKTIKYRIYIQPMFDERFKTTSPGTVTKIDYSDSNWELVAEESVFGKIDEPYIRSTLIDFSNRDLQDKEGFEGWRIKILRITPDSLTSYLRNPSFVDSIVEVYGTKLRYPYSSMVYSLFDARSFSRIPSRAYDTKLLKVKVPNNYNPILKSYGDSSQLPTSATDFKDGIAKGAATNSTYSGNTWTRTNSNATVMWDGNFSYERIWTDNPAWCFYDLITNPLYGLGDYINATQIDKWALYDIARYCDELVDDTYGGFEPRFTMNYIITSREEAFRVLNDLCSVFRGISYYTNGSVFAVQDNLKSASYQFNNSNVIDGNFTFASSSKKARHTVAVVRYNDKRNSFQPAIEYMEDEEGVRRYGIRELETSALGCTSRGQARRFAKWILASETTETETVSFSAGMDGAYLKPGDIISVYDNFRNPLKYSGRTNIVRPLIETAVPGSTVKNNPAYNSIVLDQALNFTAGTKYKLSLLTPTYDYDTVDSNMNDSNNVIRRSQIQNLIFDGSDTFTGIGTPGTFRSDLIISGSGVCSEIYFYTGTNLDPAEDYGGKTNQLDFDNYVITGYTNTAVQGQPNQTTTIDYSGGYYSGQNLIWSIEPLLENDPNYVNNNSSSYRVINIKENDEQDSYAISALLYSTGKYDDIDTVSASTVDPTSFIPYFPVTNIEGVSSASDAGRLDAFLQNYPEQTYKPQENDSDNGNVRTNFNLLEITKDIPSVGAVSTDITEKDKLLTTVKIRFAAAGYKNMINIQNEGKVVELFKRDIPDASPDDFNLYNYSENISYSVNLITSGDPQITHDWTVSPTRTPASKINPTEGVTYLVPPDTYSLVKKNQLKIITSEQASIYFNRTPDEENNIIGQFVEIEALVTKNKDYYAVVYPISEEGTIGHGLLSYVDPIKDEEQLLNSPVQNVTISQLEESNTNVTPIGDQGPDGAYRQYLSESETPSFTWQAGSLEPIYNRPSGDPAPGGSSDDALFNFGRYELSYADDTLGYRITLRKPSLPNSPNVPRNHIFIEYTGYTSFSPTPTFTLEDAINTPQLMTNLRAESFDDEVGTPNAQGHGKFTNENGTFYKVPESGIVIRDGDYLPLRNFDCTVEAQDQAGNTSAANKVYSNTITTETERFNKDKINSSYDIAEVEVQSPSGVFFAQKKSQDSLSVRYLTNEEAAEKEYPYMAQANFFPDNGGTFGFNMSEVVKPNGDTTIKEETLDKFFDNAEGVVYYYTTGSNSPDKNPAPFFVVDIKATDDSTPPKFKVQQQAAILKNNASEITNGTAFNGVVKNLPTQSISSEDKVYRGFKLFGDDEDVNQFSIPLYSSTRIPEVQNINIAFAFFDTLSKRRSFEESDQGDELDVPIYLNDGRSPKIFTDVDVNFSTSVSKIANKYSENGIKTPDFLNTAGTSIFLKEFQEQTALTKSTAFAGWAEFNVGTTEIEAIKCCKKIAFWADPYNDTSKYPAETFDHLPILDNGVEITPGDDAKKREATYMLKLRPNPSSVTSDALGLATSYDFADGTFGAGIIDLDNTLIYVGGQSDLRWRPSDNLEVFNKVQDKEIDGGKLFYKRLFLVRVKFKEASIKKGKYTVLPDIVNPMWKASVGPDPKTFLGGGQMNGLNLDEYDVEKLSIPDTTFEVVKNDDGDGLSDGFDLWIFQQAGDVYRDTGTKFLNAVDFQPSSPINLTGSTMRFRTPISTPEQLQSGGGIRIKLAIVYNEE